MSSLHYAVRRYIVEVVLIGYKWTVCKRYTQFLELHEALKLSYPNIMAMLYFPERTMFQMSKRIIEERRVALQRYILELASVSVPTPDEERWQGLLRFRQLDDFLEVAVHVCGPGACVYPPLGPGDAPLGLTTSDTASPLQRSDSVMASRSVDGLSDSGFGHSRGTPRAPTDARYRWRDLDAEAAFPVTLPSKTRPLYELVIRIASVRSSSRESKPLRRFISQVTSALLRSLHRFASSER